MLAPSAIYADPVPMIETRSGEPMPAVGKLFFASFAAFALGAGIGGQRAEVGPQPGSWGTLEAIVGAMLAWGGMAGLVLAALWSLAILLTKIR